MYKQVQLVRAAECTTQNKPAGAFWSAEKFSVMAKNTWSNGVIEEHAIQEWFFLCNISDYSWIQEFTLDKLLGNIKTQ